METNHITYFQIGSTCFEVEAIYGEEPLDELLTAYICDKLKEEQDVDKAAA